MNEPAASTLLLGVDCAVDPRNIGVCRALHDGERLAILELHEHLAAPAIAELFCAWLQETPRALVALDAPLGWPQPLGDELGRHRAGEAMSQEANALFRRRTDDVVAAALKKRPLDVGADRIARTAHAALELLRELRWASGEELPLAWSPGLPGRSSALEVYPAGTLRAHGLRASGYKGMDRAEERAELLAQLGQWMQLSDEVHGRMLRSDHLLDAAVCTLAAADFLRGSVLCPENLDLARREGWIWVHKPGAPQNLPEPSRSPHP